MLYDTIYWYYNGDIRKTLHVLKINTVQSVWLVSIPYSIKTFAFWYLSMLINDRPIVLLKFKLCHTIRGDESRATVLPIMLRSILDTSSDLFHLSAKLRYREQDLQCQLHFSFDLAKSKYFSQFLLSQMYATLSPHIAKTHRAFQERTAWPIAKYMHQLHIKYFPTIFCFWHWAISMWHGYFNSRIWYPHFLPRISIYMRIVFKNTSSINETYSFNFFKPFISITFDVEIDCDSVIVSRNIL